MPERAPQLAELERLLRHAGIVDDCSKRLLEEISDHYEDLLAEAGQSGLSGVRATQQALGALGTPADIAAEAAQRRELLNFASRHPFVAELSQCFVTAVSMPAAPIWYCAQRRDSIARWSISVGLAVVMTAGLLLSLQTVLGTL